MEPLVYLVDSQPGSTCVWNAQGGEIVGSATQHRVMVKWPQQSGLYKLSVTEYNRMGCAGAPVSQYVYIRSKQITVNAPTEACVHTQVKLSVNGGMWFRWSHGDSLAATSLTIEQDTIITVVVKDTVCSVTIDTFRIAIKALYAPSAELDGPDDDVYKGQLVEIVNTGADEGNLRWQVEKGVIRYKDAHGIRVNFTDTGKAYVKLVVTNVFGCTDSVEREIDVKAEQVYMPTAFTPNGDGLNDEFRPYGTGLKSWRLDVYNRWGQLLFSGDEHSNGWNGNYKDLPVPEEAYLYLCEGFGVSGKRFALKGTVTVLR